MDEGELAARLYWSMPTEDRAWKRVARIMQTEHGSRLGEAAVRRKGRNWEMSGRVVHTVIGANPQYDSVPRSHELERDVLRRYPIRHVMVAKCSGLFSQGPDDKTARYEDDLLHRSLAPLASSLTMALLRQRDRVGVGSGRGPAYTVECAGSRAGDSLPTIDVIMSLTGSMSVRQWYDSDRSAFLDADAVAGSLRRILQADTLLAVNRPLVCKEGDGQSALGGHLRPTKWKQRRPTLALVGIGALAGRHRLCTAERGGDLDGAWTKLQALLSAALEIDRKVENTHAGYHCVGDLCNCLFTVPPPSPHHLDEKLKRTVAKFNERAIAATTAQLAQVAEDGAVIAVAGGRHKKYVIKHVLFQEPGWITHLVTDDATAEWLCEEVDL